MDTYCQRRQIHDIDLLKLDVEGHEVEILKGLLEMLAQGRIHRIQFEYGGTYIDARILLKDMFDLLTPYGYRLHKIYPNKAATRRALRSAAGELSISELGGLEEWASLKARHAGTIRE